MKILVLYDKVGLDQAISLKNSLTGKKKKPKDGGITVLDATNLLQKRDILKELQNYTHIVAVFKENPVWLPYISGYAAGKSSVFACINENSSDIPAIITQNAHIFASYAEYVDWFNQEKTDFFEREKKSKSIETLLRLGIPVTNDSFAASITEGDEKTAGLFLDAGFSPNECNKTGVPMLCLASRAGSLKIAKILVSNKADVNKKSQDRGNTAIIDAALGKHSAIIEILIKAGADVNAASKDGQSALIMAVNLDDEESAKLLLKAGADPDTPDTLGACARKYAALFHKTGMLALFDKYKK